MDLRSVSYRVTPLVLSLTLLGGAQALAKPNIIVILTDDQEVSTLAYMPRVETLLADQGVSFTNSFVNFPVCGPSRTSFITGQASHNTGIVSNREGRGGEWDSFRKIEQDTLSVWLKAAGYGTALIGKYLNGYGQDTLSAHMRAKQNEKKNKKSWTQQVASYLIGNSKDPEATIRTSVPTGWDVWFVLIRNLYFNYVVSDNGVLVDFDKAESDYSTDVLREHAVKFIKDEGESDHPFFLLVATNAPHDVRAGEPAVPAPRHGTLFGDLAAPENAAVNEDDVSDKPTWLSEKPSLTREQLDTIQKMYAGQVGALQAVDELVAGLVDALQQTRKLNDTFIVFTSDNGFFFGDHRLTTKGDAYEGSIRVPLIIRGPGIPKGQIRTQLVNNLDVVATIAEIANLKPARVMDGHSLVPLFEQNDPPWRHALLFEGSTTGKPHQFYSAVRTQVAKYVKYSGGFEELYDLQKDPFELENQAREPAKAAELAEMRDIHARLKNCIGSSCWIP